jgi:hypothetical protein
MIEILQNEAGCAGYGNGCDHGRRGCFQLKSNPGARLSQQPTAKRAQGKTSQEHEEDRHGLFTEEHTPSQERMNGFQKVEKIIAAPSNDLDLPERPRVQDILPVHEQHFSLLCESAIHGLAHETVGSSHFPIVRRIRSGFLTSLS